MTTDLDRLKACPTCKEIKPVSEFHKDKNRPDGLFSVCKACNYAKVKAWQKANPERKQAHNRRYRTNKKESIRARQRLWAEANPEKVQARRQRQYEKRKANGHLSASIANAPAPTP